MSTPRSVGFQPTSLTTLLLVLIFASLATGQTGDFNGDGIYDCADINTLSAEIFAQTNNSTFDITGDAIVDQRDRDEWLTIAGAANLPNGNPYLLGDSNLDGPVDVSDFNIWNEHKFTLNSNYCDGDSNSDGRVDVGDFMIWNGNKFTSSLRVPDQGVLDELVTFAYDQSSGILSMDTNEIGVNCFSVVGPSPLNLLQLDNGYIDDNGAHWIFDEFAGKLKWLSADASNVSGTFELAQMETGLTADDFGVIGYMNNDWETGSTRIAITGRLVANSVPEPNGMACILMAIPFLLNLRRRK